MPSRATVAAAAATATTCGLCAAPGFLLPAPAAAPTRTVASQGASASLGAEGASSNSSAASTLSLGLAAAALVPLAVRARARRSTAVAAFESELGVQAPTGFWDPLDFCKDGDAAAFKRRRTVEIKHGRISMYACIGYIVPEYFRWPGYLSPSADLKFTDVPNGLGAFSKVPLLGWLQVLFFAGAIERTGFTFTKDAGIGFMKDSTMAGQPGDYGLGFYGAFNKIQGNPAVRGKKLNAELANGRLAMFAIMGMLFQNGTIGTTGPDMWGFTANFV